MVSSKTLNNRLRIAHKKGDEEAIIKMSTIIQREQQCSFWKKLNHVTGKKTQSAISIQVEGKGGAILDHSTQERVKQIIFSKIHNKQYTMAGETPIYNGEWFNKFGYTSNTPALRAVLDGLYLAPQDSDKAT
jgi:hypothetical protein